ncbi:MAG: tetratricopeptide repeat protein [Chromatiales bacterium]|nr:MAG: tetratricopeptide repeat protein [Chromatiales bacterium]
MDELLTDQQQAEIVRNWLRENGWVILVGLVLGLGGLFGLNEWRDYQASRNSLASQVYEELVNAVLDSRPVRAAELEAQLVGEFARSPYVDQGRLAMAKMHMDRNEAEEAAGYLQRLIDDTDDEGMQRIGSLRLARVRIQQQKYDEAIAALSGIDENSAFAGRYHEVRGDAYYAQGQVEDARREYEAALGTVSSETLNRGLVQVKLDSLGEARPAEPATAESGEPAGTAGDAPPAE